MFQENWLNYGVGGVPIEDKKGLKFYKEYKQAAVSMTKMKALTQTTWTTKTSDQQHLKTQLPPLNTVHSNLQQLEIPTNVEHICPTIAPTEYQSFHTNLSLLSEVKKNNTLTTALQQLALATINERYPPENT